MHKKITSILLALVLMIYCFPTISSAAVPLTGSKMNKLNTMTYYVHEKFGKTTFQHMNDALYLWNKASGYSLLRRDPKSRHNRSDYLNNTSLDKKSLVYRVPVEESYIAQNRVRSSNGIVYESDINFNMNKKFANSAVKDCYDVFSIFLHESGHTVGLGDATSKSDNTAVMYGDWTSRKNTITYRSLKNQDSTALKKIGY